MVGACLQAMVRAVGGVPSSPRWAILRGEGTPRTVYWLQRIHLLALAALLLAGGCATVSGPYQPPAPLSAGARTAQNLRVFDRAWELINDKFFDAKFRGVDWAARRTHYRPEAAKAA